jgi:glutamyl-tRNA reductase
MDPRVKTSASDLQQQFALSKEIYDDIAQLEAINDRAREFLKQYRASIASADIKSLRKQAAELSGASAEEDDEAPPAATPDHETLASLTQSLRAVLRLLQESDDAPTTQLAAAVEDRRHAVAELLNRAATFETAVKAAKLPPPAKGSSAIKPQP